MLPEVSQRLPIACAPPRENAEERLATPSAPAGRPWQFRLPALLLIVACISACFALLRVIGPAGSTLLIWCALLVLAHVVANARGARRTRAELSEGDARPFSLDQDDPIRHAARAAAAPSTQLSARRPLGQLAAWFTVGGAFIGALAGVTVLAMLYAQQGAIGAVAFGTGAAAVLGGFVGFMASTIFCAFLPALGEAASHRRAPRTPG